MSKYKYSDTEMIVATYASRRAKDCFVMFGYDGSGVMSVVWFTCGACEISWIERLRSIPQSLLDAMSIAGN